ncbi:hypothetical protein [Actinomadura rugatobispora]|uniref:Uncharacterized protein n=1 Tax=Actinomadura rugatobispora TaxID=1994 RepID=A0ABW1A7Z6_9ACTN|nr:hypothetical protein GCM10010200_063390 [Actinomadura rugatobispora]
MTPDPTVPPPPEPLPAPAFPAVSPPPGRPRRSARSIAAIAVLALLGVAAVVGGAVPVVADLTREPTEREVRAAGEKEIGVRWRVLKASAIFPARLDHRVRLRSEGGRAVDPPAWSALRAGIAPAASCARAFDAAFARVMDRHGCRTVLRATYVDDTGTLVATLGLAVMPDAARALRAESDLGATYSRAALDRTGLRAVPFPGTAAAGFGDARRAAFGIESNGTPYLFFRASGWVADRGRPAPGAVAERFEFARTGLNSIVAIFAATTAVCEREGVRC